MNERAPGAFPYPDGLPRSCLHRGGEAGTEGLTAPCPGPPLHLPCVARSYLGSESHAGVGLYELGRVDLTSFPCSCQQDGEEMLVPPSEDRERRLINGQPWQGCHSPRLSCSGCLLRAGQRAKPQDSQPGSNAFRAANFS